MNRLKDSILNATGGTKGLVSLCITTSIMVIVLVLISPYILYPSSPTTTTSSPHSSRVIQRPSEQAYAEIAEIIRLEELDRKLEAILEESEEIGLDTLMDYIEGLYDYISGR